MNRRGFFGMIAALFVAKPAMKAAPVSPIAPHFTSYFETAMLPAINDMIMNARYPLMHYTPVTPVKYGQGFSVSKELLESDEYWTLRARARLTAR